jgi:chromosome partitioning protein
MAEIIAIVNQKGGVGKTTSALNLSACLAALGHNTLLRDADPPGNSTSGLGISMADLPKNVYHVLMGEARLEDIVMDTPVANLHLIPANRDLLGIDHDLEWMEARQTQLKLLLDAQLRRPDGADKYGFVIIDSPPNLNLLAINIMAAAGRLIIPTPPEYLPLEGLAELTETFTRVRNTVNSRLSILGILITMHLTTNLSREVTQNLRKNMGQLVFDTVIPRNVRLAEAPSFCLPIIMYDPKAPGALSYQAAAREILDRIGVK